MAIVHAGSKNVYADLGSKDAAEMIVKAQLAHKINTLIKRKHLTRIEAAALFGMSQAKISGMLRGQFRGISEDRMMRCLIALGQNVEIVIKPARAGKQAVLSVAA